jgi:hypothetical protein
MAAPGKIVGMTKAAAVTSASVPFVPFATSVRILFGCFCGRGAWLLARRFDKPSVGHDNGRCRSECESSASVPFVPFATFCSNPLRLLLWAGDVWVLARFQNEVEGAESEGARFPYLEKQIGTK